MTVTLSWHGITYQDALKYCGPLFCPDYLLDMYLYLRATHQRRYKVSSSNVRPCCRLSEHSHNS